MFTSNIRMGKNCDLSDFNCGVIICARWETDESGYLQRDLDPTCLVSTVQAAAGGKMVWGMFCWNTLGNFIAVNWCLNATAYFEHFGPLNSNPSWF